MDPLTAIGLAGTIVQFVDFGSRLIREGCEVSKSGASKLNEQAEAVTKDLLDFSTKLQRSPRHDHTSGPPSDNEVAIRKLCLDCNKVAAELLARLNILKPKLTPPKDLPNSASREDKAMRSRKLKEYRKEVQKLGNSLWLALMSVWSREELIEIEERLEKYRIAIQARMVAYLV